MLSRVSQSDGVVLDPEGEEDLDDFLGSTSPVKTEPQDQEDSDEEPEQPDILIGEEDVDEDELVLVDESEPPSPTTKDR